MSKYFRFFSNKSPLSYLCRESMTFFISAIEDGKNISCEHIKWEIRGDDGKILKGIGSCTTEKELVLKTTIERPGFVHIICTAVDENCNEIENFDILNAGVGAQINEIEYHDIIPGDFDDYWQDIEKLVDDFPLEVIYKQRVTQNVRKDFIAYYVQIKTPCGRPASGCITIPDKNGKFPIRIEFSGYGIGNVDFLYEDNTIFAYFNAHGIENYLSKEEIEYKYKDELDGYGFSNEENSSNKTTYFRNMMIRNLIATKFLKTLPCWDGNNLIASGGSQGAMQATTVAAHDKNVTYLLIDVPWFCDLNAIASGYMRGWRPDFAQGLRYFDTVAQATRVKCPVSIKAGLGDYICPPSSIMSLYNSLNTKKDMKFIQCRTHSYMPPEVEEIEVD